MNKYELRGLRPDETGAALALVRRVFMQFEAPDYAQEGTDEFFRSLQSEEWLSYLAFYGAFDGSSPVGVLATRRAGSHIALFFVDGAHQRRGIGRALFALACENCASDKLTVNASPCALPVYRALGFSDTGAEQTKNGIRFTPMECARIPALAKMLTAADSLLACGVCGFLCEESRRSDVCYPLLDSFAALLEHKNSLVRSRAIALLAANAKWDREDRLDAAADSLLSHITDEKPIAARQCIKALPGIAKQKPQLSERIAAALQSADPSGYADSMRPLIEKDIAAALKSIKEER